MPAKCGEFSLVVLLFCMEFCFCGKQPNIVFIIADDLGWNDVGYHGSEIRTPYIDQLAREGVRLERYYVPPVCGPSRSCLMSGRYQINIGIQHGNYDPRKPQGLPLNVTTLAQVLQQTNYSTHLVGKWHLGFYKQDCLPTNRGFDTFYGLYTGAADHFNHTREDLPGRYLDLHRDTTPDISNNGTYSGDIFADEAIDIIRKHSENNSEQPLFLVFSSQLPHGPVQAPLNYLQKYSNISYKKRQGFAAMVTFLDDSVRRIHAELVHSGIWENTILVFTTDNGGTAHSGGRNLPLRGEKGTLYEGGVRAVGFVNSPLLANHRKGAELHSLMHMTDWFPTLVGLAGGNVSGLGLDGVDQWPAINNYADEIESPRDEVLHNIDHLTVYGLDVSQNYSCGFNTSIRAAITVGRWKLLTGYPGKLRNEKPIEGLCSNTNNNTEAKEVYTQPGLNVLQQGTGEMTDQCKHPLQLYDILTDPVERNDVSGSMTDVVDRLLCRLKWHSDQAKEAIWPPDHPNALPPYHGASLEPYL